MGSMEHTELLWCVANLVAVGGRDPIRALVQHGGVAVLCEAFRNACGAHEGGVGYEPRKVSRNAFLVLEAMGNVLCAQQEDFLHGVSDHNVALRVMEEREGMSGAEVGLLTQGCDDPAFVQLAEYVETNFMSCLHA